MGTYEHPFDTVTDELGLRLCSMLEIDPGQTTSIELTVDPGLGAVVRWSGVKRLSLEEVSAAVNGTAIPAWEQYDDEPVRRDPHDRPCSGCGADGVPCLQSCPER